MVTFCCIVVGIATTRQKRSLIQTALGNRSRPSRLIQRRQPLQCLLPIRTAHFVAGLQACTKARPLRSSEDRAAHVVGEVRASHARRLAVRHAGQGRGDGGRDATGTAAWAAVRHAGSIGAIPNPRQPGTSLRPCPLFADAQQDGVEVVFLEPRARGIERLEILEGTDAYAMPGLAVVDGHGLDVGLEA